MTTYAFLGWLHGTLLSVGWFFITLYTIQFALGMLLIVTDNSSTRKSRRQYRQDTRKKTQNVTPTYRGEYPGDIYGEPHHGESGD